LNRRRIHDDRPADSQIAQLDVRAAGFIATKHVDRVAGGHHVGAAKWIWNAETPNVVPVGARISAGKSGNVEKIAAGERRLERENWLPVTASRPPRPRRESITTESRVLVAGGRSLR